MDKKLQTTTLQTANTAVTLTASLTNDTNGDAQSTSFAITLNKVALVRRFWPGRLFKQSDRGYR